MSSEQDKVAEARAAIDDAIYYLLSETLGDYHFSTSQDKYNILLDTLIAAVEERTRAELEAKFAGPRAPDQGVELSLARLRIAELEAAIERKDKLGSEVRAHFMDLTNEQYEAARHEGWL